MSPHLYVIAISCIGIALAVWLIARIGLHPFVGLLSAAALIGLAAGLPPQDVIAGIEKGFSDILRGTGLVVALGLGLGAILQVSGGAQALARHALAATGTRHASLGALIAALLIGLPLFFETGVVLLLPIIAAGLSSVTEDKTLRLRVMLSALAGLSVLHALLPPHPGPLIAAKELGAPLVHTMALGLAAAIPTALIAGPLLARFTTRGVRSDGSGLEAPEQLGSASAWRALLILMLPVGLIALGAALQLDSAAGAAHDESGWIRMVSDPVMALLLANLAGLILLLGRQVGDRRTQDVIWSDAVRPAGSIMLAIGAGGALKQILVAIGLPDIFAKLATLELLSPIIIAWLVAASIRLATGSATVATITASGIMSQVAAQSGVDPTLLVLAIGAGSVFFSHVNDPGFWLVKGYLGISTRDTFRTWSMLETAISVVGLAMVLLLQFLTAT